MERSTFLLTSSILVILVALGTADALLVERENFPSSSRESSSPTPPPLGGTGTTIASSASSSPTGVKKIEEVDILETVARMGFTAQQTEERSLLTGVIQRNEDVHTFVLLRDNDRAGLISWIETPLVKQYFLILKESLHTLFSPQLKDLLDETQNPAGKPPRNFLTFLDPAISEERLVFVRIRDRLIELHIGRGNEDALFALIEVLSG
jgi:hypothetical protein